MNISELRDPGKFIESQVRLEPSGELLRLEDWQRKVLGDLFPNGVGPLPYGSALLSLPAKTGKTSFTSAICTWHLFNGWNDFNVPLILIVSNSREQSQHLGFRKLCYSINNNPTLAASCKVYKDRVLTSTGGEARVIPSGRPGSVAGVEYSLLWADELHASTDESMSLMAELKPSSFRQSLILYTSYAGTDRSGYFYHLWQIAEKKQDPRLYSYISHDPQISSWVSKEHIESEKLRLPEWQWNRLYLNQWSDPSQQFISADDWERCLADIEPVGSDELMYCGLDVAIRKDSSCLCGVVKDGDSFRLAHFKAWQPGRGKSNEIQLERIYEYVLELNQSYNVSSIFYDPRYATSLAQRWRQKGVNCIEVSPQAASMSRVFSFLSEVVKSGRFQHWGEKLLTSHVLNAVAKIGPYGPMLEKPSKGVHIDACVSLSLGLWAASQAGTLKIELMRVDPVDSYPDTRLGPWRGVMKPHRDHGRMRRTVDFFHR